MPSSLVAAAPSLKHCLSSARRALASDNFAEAMEHYEQALERDPECADAHAGRAELLYRQGKWEESRAAALKAVSAKPVHVPALTVLARVALKSGEVGRMRTYIKCLLNLGVAGAAEAGQALIEEHEAAVLGRLSHGAFDAYTSLGNNCEPAIQMLRIGYEEGSLFRYTLSSTDELCRLIAADFAGVYQRENLVPCSDNMVRDTFTGVSFHSELRSRLDPETGRRDFRTDFDFDAIYRKEAEKIAYLVDKWRRLAASDARVLYVRKHDGSDPRLLDPTKHEGGHGRMRAQALRDLLAEKYPRHDFTLMFLQKEEEREDDWAMPRVVNRYFSRFACRHKIHDGDIPAWDSFFAAFPLRAAVGLPAKPI